MYFVTILSKASLLDVQHIQVLSSVSQHSCPSPLCSPLLWRSSSISYSRDTSTFELTANCFKSCLFFFCFFFFFNPFSLLVSFDFTFVFSHKGKKRRQNGRQMLLTVANQGNQDSDNMASYTHPCKLLTFLPEISFNPPERHFEINPDYRPSSAIRCICKLLPRYLSTHSH